MDMRARTPTFFFSLDFVTRMRSHESAVSPAPSSASTSSKFSGGAGGILQAEIALDRRGHSLSASPPRQVSADAHGMQGDVSPFGTTNLVALKDEVKVNTSMVRSRFCLNESEQAAITSR